jgi:hypothetical protein
MKLRNKAEYCGRLSVTVEKASSELDTLLDKWFSKHFISGLKLPLLKSMSGTDGFIAFEAMVFEVEEAKLIAAVRKLDPHNVELLHRGRPELIAHLRDLAAGRVQPAAKPRTTKAKSSTAAKKTSSKEGVLSRSRQ